jgi:pSer/pThr/pTyr-binding forkhead associated (FHA) protein
VTTPPAAIVWVLAGADGNAALTFRFGAGAVKTLGRAPRADFVLDAPLVSRLHCRLTAFEDLVEVVDLTSTNGTYVNDSLVHAGALRSGDRLRVGRVELTLRRG